MALKRRRGIVPNDLRRRVDALTPDFAIRAMARFIARELDGFAPSALTAEERADVVARWETEGLDPEAALDVLERAGYGAPRARRARADRAHGLRREDRLRGVPGKLPRALALRLPTSADTHRSGPNNGTDRWGPVSCSRTLRAAHLGIVGALAGLWQRRAGAGEGYVDVTAAELVHLLTGRHRVGGKDLVWIHGLLADLEALDLHAEVTDRSQQRGAPAGGPPSEAHRIPSTPIAAVERRIGDRWVSAVDYAAAKDGRGDADLVELYAAERASCGGPSTLRVHLAEWVIAELTHEKRRPVFLNFDVWAYLRPQGQRTYAFLQGHHRDDYDERLYFYLGAPTLYTLGLTGRIDRCARSVSHDLAALWHGDRRYHQGRGFRHQTHGASGLPAFAFDAAKGIASAPTPEALAHKSAPKRPSGLRGLATRNRRHSQLSPRVRGADLDPAHVSRVGIEAAQREHQAVRDTIERSLASAGATDRPLAIGRPAVEHQRRQAKSRGDDDPGSG